MKINKITINTAINNVTHSIKDKAENLNSVLPKELPLEKDIYNNAKRPLRKG